MRDKRQKLKSDVPQLVWQVVFVIVDCGLWVVGCGEQECFVSCDRWDGPHVGGQVADQTSWQYRG